MAYTIIFAPLIGFLIAGLFGRKIGDLGSQIITSSLIFLSAIISCYYLYQFIIGSDALNFVIFNWISSGQLNLNWSIYIDTLTAVMLVVVTSVSFLVHVYSIGYMSHDPDKPRFMSYLSLFTFAMLMLITSDNFLQLFFGWEGVGLASYLLIGFWFKKPSANAAAIKAFVVNNSKTNLTTENYIGIAAEAISDGATGKINIAGGINSSQTGLTTSRTYYVQKSGDVGLTSSIPNVVAGTSISSTQIIVR